MASDKHTSPLRQLLTLAWPVIVARSAQAVIGFADTLMTSPLGESAIAATTSGAMNVFALAILPMGCVFIVQSFAAQLSARGELETMWRYAHYALMLAFIAGAAGVLAAPFVPHLLTYLPHEDAVRVPMGSYISLRLWALGGIVGVEAIGNWYGGRENTALHMRASLIAMVLNVGLNYLLIEGHLGAPALGVEGAAIASVIATYSGFGYLLWTFMRDRRSAPKMGQLRIAEFRRMLRFGVPNGLNWFLEFAAFLFFLDVVVADLGTLALASMMIVFHINSIAFMPAFGLASAGAILSGQAIGSGDRDAVPAIAKLTAKVAASWQLTIGLIYFAVPGLILGIFAPPTENAAALVLLGTAMLRISVAWQLFDAIGMVVGETLRAAGDTKWCMWARLTVAWLFFAPMSYFVVELSGGDPLVAISCIVVYLASLSAVLTLRFRSGAWRKIELTDPGLVAEADA
jgi:MATE family multidrug resistance protein